MTFAVIFLTPVLHGLMVVDTEMILGGVVVYAILSVFAIVLSRLIPAIGGEMADMR